MLNSPYSTIRRSLLRLLALLSITLLGFAPVASSALPQDEAPAIAYRLVPRTDPAYPHLEISVTIPVLNHDEAVSVQMPVWSPGDYHVQDHSQYVQNLAAWSGDPAQGKRLPVTRIRMHTWMVATQGAEVVTVTYVLPVTPPGFFSENVQILPKQVFVNGPAAYVYVLGRKTERVSLTVRLPQEWQAVMALTEKRNGDEITYTAPDYDTLSDSPLVIGDRDQIKVETFTVSGKQHRAAFFSHPENIQDTKEYRTVLTRIVESYQRTMGSLPYSQYCFFFDVGGVGGGLEHLNGTRMAIGGQGAKAIAHFAAHEYFHLWNVKRIRPKALGPFDYLEPPKTRNLWFSEGVTDYYAALCVRRAGFVTEERFLSRWGGAIRSYQNAAAYRKTSADESSLRVWEAGNSSGYGISYYFKGMLIGLCLDLKIRHVTENKKSLDDVMRELMKRTNPPKPGFEEDEIRDVANLIAGRDLTAFYNLLTRTADPMPFAECLGYAGLDITGKPLETATPEQIAIRKEWAKTFFPAKEGE